jgi:glyoxylase-like metal-dependent hydrolase (beta-lactamase superfamily II)
VGHICLYERTKKAFLSGDHILNPISPSVGLHAQSMGNPLSDYLSSLHAIREMDVEMVLPAHGDEFGGFRERIGELLEHHEERLQEICGILGDTGLGRRMRQLQDEVNLEGDFEAAAVHETAGDDRRWRT